MELFIDVMAVFCFGMSAFAWMNARKESKRLDYVRNMLKEERVEAKIVGFVKEGLWFMRPLKVRVQYKTPEGEVVEKVLELLYWGILNLKVGKVVEVCYKSENPHEAIIITGQERMMDNKISDSAENAFFLFITGVLLLSL